MTAPPLIIFDKDGTLFGFGASWDPFVADILEELAGDAPKRKAQLAAALGFDLSTGRILPGASIIGGTLEETAADMLAVDPSLDANTLLPYLINRAAQVSMAPVPGLTQTLAQLRAAGIRLAVMTNDAEVAARAHLVEAGIADQFDHIVGYDSGHGAKPQADPLLAIARLAGVVPGACLMVGDSLHDLRAGQAAGMGTVGVLTGLADQTELAPWADVILPSIADLTGWLGL